MILLADVGASTAKVVYLGSMFAEGKSARIVCKGFNPTYHTEEEIYERISGWPIPKGIENDVHSIIFYGAGCKRLEGAKKVSSALKKRFARTSINVHSDLLAPIHANHNQEGFYSILGTGSVCCHFDGQSIHLLRPSLGFLMNDIGSGFYIGHEFLTRFLRGEIEHKSLNAGIREHWGYTPQQVDWISLENDPTFQSKVASLVETIAPFQHDADVHSVLISCFESWANDIMEQVQDPIKKIHLSGSIGFYFKEVIHEVLMSKDIHIGQCIASPMTVLEKRLIVV
ncbi:MAG TPA: hypothetical protein DCF84_02010 [Bacteroidetes bacterium]|nr:hypothetical protein [Bacteroidota bacterium]|tara:strand:+ start:271 stop:1122 length:852 start_codon:yes stop_codon:yes gene_type:complete